MPMIHNATHVPGTQGDLRRESEGDGHLGLRPNTAGQRLNRKNLVVEKHWVLRVVPERTTVRRGRQLHQDALRMGVPKRVSSRIAFAMFLYPRIGRWRLPVKRNP